MKKILVSDYDGTLYKSDEITKKNIIAVNSFRKNNIFCIATGRSYEDFLKAKQKYNIECNYYLLNYGALVYDETQNIIYENPLLNSDIDKIVEFFKDKECNIYYCNSKYNTLYRSDKVYKIILTYNDKNKQMNDYYNFINKYKNYNVFILKNHFHIEIVSGNVDKGKAIDIIGTKEKSNNIYVIGDSLNDISMIKKYGGCCVENAEKEIKQISTEIYKDVYNYIEKLMEESHEKDSNSI